MRDFRFGIKPIKESTRVEARLKSIFGLKPLKKVAEEETGFSFEPISHTFYKPLSYQRMPIVLKYPHNGRPVGKIIPIELSVSYLNFDASDIFIYPPTPLSSFYHSYFSFIFSNNVYQIGLNIEINDNLIDLYIYSYGNDLWCFNGFPTSIVMTFRFKFQDENGNIAWLDVTVISPCATGE